MDRRKKEFLMERSDIENYLDKLKEFERTLNSDDNVDGNFIKELDNVLSTLSHDIEEQMSPKTPDTNKVITDNFFKQKDVMVKVKKLDQNAVIPSYSKVGDAGMDLTITREIENTSFSVSYGFGIAMEIPKGYVGLIFPRSSVRNQELILSNCVGVIDSGYRGELQATFKKTNGLDSIKYKVGERGAQIIILPYPTVYMTEVLELSDSERGTGGFGSTGK
jgi:dUTP pyrophosphatase